MPVKANQKSLLDDIRTLFEPVPSAKTTTEQIKTLKKIHDALGAHTDTYQTIEKGHGWIQTRTLTASTALTDYMKWPGLAQVYQYRCERKHTRTGKITHQTQSGITEFITYTSIRRTFTATSAWTLDNRESIASHARYDLWRGCLTGPLWQHTASHGGVAQCCANARTRRWIY